MTQLYELIILGKPQVGELKGLKNAVAKIVKEYDFHLGREVIWRVNPTDLGKRGKQGVAAIYFGHLAPADSEVSEVVRLGIPVLPVVRSTQNATKSLPPSIQPLNAISTQDCKPLEIAAAFLSSVGLLPKQRRVFLSYRRTEAREAAIQLFDELSKRKFSVFLDTHIIGAGEPFQESLWHNLCDCDVLIMLDTKTYFDSRWTEAEFGRALAKSISVLRVGWPAVKASNRVATADRVDLKKTDISRSGKLSDSAIQKICLQLEETRCKSHAVRSLAFVSKIREATEKVRGKVLSVGSNMAVHIELANKKKLVIYPQLGVPTSQALHLADEYCTPFRKMIETPTVAYDHIGLLPSWQDHLTWLGAHVKVVRWMQVHDAAWRFADWDGVA